MLTLEKIVLQPTSLCNLNCSYCYLPSRDKNLKMSIEVAQRVFESIRNIQKPIAIIWHGGEPLACGVEYFKKLLDIFEPLRLIGLVIHHVQTNATLLDNEFVSLIKYYKIEVGVSIDGPEWANNLRVNWNGTPAFKKVMVGIDLLKHNEISFGVIAVVNNENINRPKELYEFFSQLRCHSFAINIEEQEGDNLKSAEVSHAEVYQFWKELFKIWSDNPILNIREFSRGLSWIHAVANQGIDYQSFYDFDYFPSVAYNGDVVLLSPELLDTKSLKYGDFIVGNVLTNNLLDIVENSSDCNYIMEYKTGKEKCSQDCDYYSFCRGGQASNKFFELNSLDGTETLHCIRSKKLLIDSILDHI
jgi:uncharacterized protein